MFKACKYRKRKQYKIRSDGLIWHKTSWRTLKSVINMNQKQYEKGFIKYEKNKKILNRKRTELRRKRPEVERKRWMDWYRANWTRERAKEIKRRIGRNPSYGLIDAISQYRSGDITYDELNRRLDKAIEGTHELVSKRKVSEG